MKKCSHCGAEYPDDAVICANDSTPLYYSPASPTGISSSEEKHSGIGIASFITSIAVGALMLAVFVAAAILSRQRTPGEQTYPGQVFVGLAALFLLAADVVAAGLGIAALFQRGRKKVYGILGLVFSSATLVGTVGLIIIGLAYARRHLR